MQLHGYTRREWPEKLHYCCNPQNQVWVDEDFDAKKDKKWVQYLPAAVV